MNATSDHLRSELERLFELDELKALSSNLLGLSPDEVGGAAGKATFARALVERVSEEGSTAALLDAMVFSKKGVKELDAASGEDLAAGTTLEGWKILKKLGEGGVGVTYLAEKGSERAAVKVVRFLHARDKGASRRWLVAQRALAQLDDKGLAKVLASGVLADGRPWVATSFVEGQLLGARIARTGPMHFNEARPIVRGVLSALEVLHARGLAHGNVKMENVFVVRPQSDKGASEPTGVLVDAAADRLVARNGAPSSAGQAGVFPVAGSAKAIAPEHARLGRAVPSADVYAVGTLLYEVLTGKLPFSGESAFEVLARHLTTDPEAPSSVAPRGWVSKELDAIVLRALAKNPADRFASASALREALEMIGRVSVPPEARKKEALDQAAFDKAKAALLAKPSDEELAAALERIAAPAEEWKLATDALVAASDKVEEKEAKKALLFRAARLLESDAKDHAGAEGIYKKLLEIDGEDEIARAGLEELKRHSGDAEGLVELLLEKVEREKTAHDRAAVLREIAETYENQLKDEDNAYVAYVQALSEDPRHETTVSAIERLAKGKNERWNEAIGALNEAVAAADGRADKVAMYVLMGRWYADELGRPDFALPCYSQAVTLDPASEDALDGTVALYRKAQSYPELAAILLKRAEVASPTKARDFKAEAAEILHRRLNDGKRATDLYEQILADDAAHPKATEALEMLYSERKEWDGLVKLLEKKAQGQRGADRVDTLCALAEVYEDRLSKLDEAATQYEAALAESPKLVPALKGLERIYAQKGRYDALLKNLETQLETVATPRQRIGIWERIGGIQEEEFVDHKAAASAYESIVAIEPGHDAANAALARVYRQLQRFDDLASTLERHALASSDEPRKINLLLQAARVLTVDVGAPERAANMAERVLSVKPDHPEALELLARLKAKSGDKNAAVDAVRKLAEAESDKAKKADFYVRAGRILEEGGDKDGAIAQYKLALDANKDDTNAAAALRAVYASRGDAHGAADLLQREIEVTEGASKKAQLFAELGRLRRDRLKDDAGAKDAYKKAIELDSTCTPAARGLGDLAFDAGDFVEAGKLYEPLLARTSEMSSEDALATCIRCGDALRKAQQFDKAQRAYLNAKSLAPNDREVLERVAEVTFDSGAADEAAELYRDLLKQGGKELTGADRGRIVWRLGDALRRSEQLDEAKTYLEEAAQLLPGQPEALSSLKELFASKNEWEKVVATLKRRIDVAPDSERFELLVEQGDVLLGKLHDKARAGKSYVSALELKGDDRNLLSKLMAVYSETKDWGKLVEVILRIAELVSDKAQLAKYYNTAAAISHMELGRLDEAADYYEQALDLSAGVAKAFEGLVSALTQKQDWARLEKAYRDQLRRTESSATPKEQAHLWDSLGELLKHRLNRPADAVEAFEKAQKLEPDNRRRAEQLAEIFAKEPKKFFQQSVRVHQQLLVANPYRIESYQALRKLYTEAKKPDESWCVCQALTMLKNAEPDEEGFFKKHRRRQPAAIKEVLTEELWQGHVQHPDQDPLLTQIFTAVSPAVFAVRSQPLASFKLEAAKKRDAEKDEADMARTLWYAAQATRIALPDIYYRDDDPGALGYVFSSPAAISLGKAGRGSAPSQVLAFLCGRHLAYFRGGMFLRLLVPTGSGLRAWLLAAIKTQVAQFPIPGDLATQVEEHMRAIQQHLSGPQREVLRSHVNKLLASAPELDLKRWTAAVDLTADRVGFLLANDLEAATAIVRASPDEASAVPQKDRLRELHLYSVSEPYLTLRHKLGIAIGD
jgi:tetratricopeptide (TPR) repeat protein